MIGTACGKVILLGEHAVVYGVPAIAVGIDRGARAEAARTDAVSCTLALGDAVRASPADGSDTGRAFGAVLAACGVDFGVEVKAETTLPPGAGLGCSAALGVAIVRALDGLVGRAGAPPDEVAERAMAWERVFHGNPSGVDTTTAARGGCLRFERGEAGASVRAVRLARPLVLAVGHTGVASSTRTMVEGLAHLRERRPDLVAKSFEAIRSLVDNAAVALETGDHAGLGHLLDLGQMVLSGLMLSTAEIETLCRVAREAGALGAKLTGAGGGGCVLALVAGDAGPVLGAWERAGFRGFATTVGGATETP